MFFGPIHHAVRLTKKIFLQRIPKNLLYRYKPNGIVIKNVSYSYISASTIKNSACSCVKSSEKRRKQRKSVSQRQNGIPRYKRQTRKIHQKIAKAKVKDECSCIKPRIFHVSKRITKPTPIEKAGNEPKNNRHNTLKSKHYHGNTRLESYSNNLIYRTPNITKLKLILMT